MAPRKNSDKERNKRLNFDGYTWAKLSSYLQSQLDQQANNAKKINEILIPKYVNLSGEELEHFLKHEGKGLSREVRGAGRARLIEAQQRLEDFLFYQNTMNRWKRWHAVEASEKQKQEAVALRKEPMLINACGEHHNYLRKMLNHYDKLKVGTPGYICRDVKEDENQERQDPVRVGPEDLHLWTPLWRRVPAGLRSLTELRRLQAAIEEPIQLQLDEEALEETRRRFDDVEVDPAEELAYPTHSARRQAERETYAGTRPSTSHIRVIESKKGTQIDDDRFHNIQSKQGVFISAFESSYDWLTSYDCLDLVKVGDILEHFETSAVREEDWFDGPPGDDEDLNLDPDATDDMTNTPRNVSEVLDNGQEELLNDGKQNRNESLPLKETSRGLRSRKSTSTTPIPEVHTASSKKKKKKKKATASKKPATIRKNKTKKIKPENKSEGRGEDEQGPGDKSREMVTADIDYSYERREFGKRRKVLECSSKPIQTTTWAEATDGRREWHVGMALTPVSPVDSPPHSPIEPEVIEWGSITIGCEEAYDPVNNTGFPEVEQKIRRCPHKDVKCRAWWPHPIDECWKVHKEPTSLPTNRMEIDPPIEPQLPEDRRKNYRDRLHDHYGRTGSAIARWPRLGIRIPYEPTTFCNFKHISEWPNEDRRRALTRLRKSGVDEEMLVEDLPRKEVDIPLQAWRSLPMPVITKPFEPWNMDEDTFQPGDPNESDSGESDDDGDLFRYSYFEGSFPNGLPTSF
jgi:hypothetical protein